MKLDQMAYWLVVENLRSDWLTPIMESFSALATPVSLIAMLLVIAAFAPGKRPGWFCTVNLALAVLLNVVLKTLIQRPRPEGFRLAVESGFSFPRPPMAAMAFFGPDRLDGVALRAGPSPAPSADGRVQRGDRYDRHQPNLPWRPLRFRRA